MANKKRSMNKKEKDHLNRVADIGCIVCRNMGFYGTPAEIHHIGNMTMAKKASNFEVTPLCHTHHRTGNHGVAVHSGRKAFELNYGTEKELLEQVRCLLSD